MIAIKFYIPPNLEGDFKDWLATDVAHANYDFELIRNWYEQDPETKVTLRALYFPINWKSKIGNSDANSNFKTSYDVTLHKGDIVIRNDGDIYMLNWKVQNMPNNQSTQAVDCNAKLIFTRHINEELDSQGYLIAEAHDEVIAPEIPCVFSEYTGRPDYATSYNTPGINPDHLLTVQVQWNDRTSQLRMGDEFRLHHSTYRVVDVVTTEVDMDGQFGILNLMARRVAGKESI